MPAIKEFHALVEKGIAKNKLLIVLNHLATRAEELASQAYLKASGYQYSSISIYEKPSYRQIQNEGKSITEVNYPTLRKQAQELVKDLLRYLN
ncbi:MAG: hypothetical protein mread185_000305 [Mycoplasmataceae bacterium]|nr:MAG: hypothetical protein mread185_000305 [Mycoplasmataceae bacterium]